MASIFDEIAAKAKLLPLEDRARLIEELLRDLEGEPDGTPEEIAAAWDEEIKRRVAEMEAGHVQWVPAEEVMKEVRAIIASHRK